MSTNLDDVPPHRKHPTHGIVYIEGQSTIIFDTVCTKDRLPWLTDDFVHHHLREVWQEAIAWLLGRYVIMPDHIHFFAGATESMIPYENWVKYWKSQFTKRLKVARHQWQADHWEVRLRNEAQLRREMAIRPAKPSTSRFGAPTGGLAIPRRTP